MMEILSRLNPNSLSGASDIIIVEYEDGSMKSSPWHLRIGNLGLIHHLNKVISVTINDTPAPFMMYVNKWGIGQFFASQKMKAKAPAKNMIYPSVTKSQLSVSPGDIRGILGSKSNKKPINSEISTYLTRNSAVDIDAAFIYDDPDPEPISTAPSSVDLVQSVSSSTFENDTEMIKGIESSAPVPSSMLLQIVRPLIHFGRNEIEFTVSSLLQGPKVVKALLFLLKASDKIVVSDIDGTVTKSDAIGQVFGAIGADWTQPGLAKLYDKIASYGCQFIYLTARPVSQASVTRHLLSRIDQEGTKLPDGPCILAPDGFIHAFTREVVKREPQKFKIPTIDTIIKLFPDDKNPVVLALGNKNSDVISYESNKITREKIFLFDTKHHVLSADGKVVCDSIIDWTPQIQDYLGL
ncbi:SMP2 protein-related protein [Trichomonas vaginalis G3]|uniref:SMP2 protein-related protein n=1 Tax=Trichomonas vaginalis (strain ATCC PRA-98 / G3) TaxID=412133 RepID=A2DTF8_TRIV3|nr:phosphatidate phosphatase protein [Trichomonas vaginalis G3]EAY16267.1 SMP2 protein-related protein [Trichomonas vaginalis G3]KAI5523417.1 phosphatidate phosphatase protein [Trichomonas vaginalis G3]|eukprot:XP_001328490.1 SMP2 protein-related protein [Trichomonas vaginalis G3]